MKPKKKKAVKTIEEKRLELGSYLADLRGNSNLSLKDLEKAVGIPGAVLCRLEHGENKVTLENAMRLADFFSVDLSDISDLVR